MDNVRICVSFCYRPQTRKGTEIPSRIRTKCEMQWSHLVSAIGISSLMKRSELACGTGPSCVNIKDQS